MGFVLFFIALFWLIAWPSVMYYYFKEQNTSRGVRITSVHSDTFSVQPITTPHGVRTELKAGDSVFFLDEQDVGNLITRLRRTQLTVSSMNEVRKLEE